MLEFDEKLLKNTKFIDLFAGIGGFRIALESLGGECVYSNEWDVHAQKTYEENFGEKPAGDITKVDEKTIPKHDIICAGFPCFPAGASVMTDKGVKPIEEIEVGDQVLTHKGRYRAVTRIGKKEGAETVILSGYCLDGEIECTPNHPFLSKESGKALLGSYTHVPENEEWTEAKDMLNRMWFALETDDEIRSLAITGRWGKCTRVRTGRKNVTVYNIEVEEDHSYTVSGIAVHNCQAFSISGKKRGFADTRGTLFFDIARIVREHKPAVVFMENVKNFAVHDDGNTLRVVKATMEQLGYTFDYKVLNSAKYGAPTTRERCYMVCFRKDLGIEKFNFPKPTKNTKHVKDILLKRNDPKYGKELKELVVERADMKLTSQEPSRTVDRPFRLGVVGRGGQGERIYSIKGTAITLSAHGGGAFAKTGGYMVNNKPRRLHPRECARVMCFPDTFEYNESWAQAYKQFGNSVVIDVLQRIAYEIAKQLQEIEFEGEHNDDKKEKKNKKPKK